MLATRERNWLPLVLIAVLLGLLTVLAALQYRWLGQISDAESVRLKSRLVDDTRRFSEDFNREIQMAYFGFQASSDVFKPGEKNEFAKRYEFWRQSTAYPELINEIYFYRNSEDAVPLRFDRNKYAFEEAEWSAPLSEVRSAIGDGRKLQAILSEPIALTLPVFEEKKNVEHFVIRTRKILHSELTNSPGAMTLPDKYGFLIVLLNPETISESVLPDLVAKYFSDTEGANFNLAVLDDNGEVLYRKGNGEVTSADASVPILDLKPNNFAFYGQRKEQPGQDEKKPGSELVVTEKIESRNVTAVTDRKGNVPLRSDEAVVDVNVSGSGESRITVFESKGGPLGGIWTLNVQHNDGSLDQYVANTRNRNLAVSFGILGLLAVSVILIFISSQRAKRLAQNQLEFVSSVSHEFRTPLAVIYSAAENLSDGVVEDRSKIGDYGTLIKREGRRLSGMVEQILEFAGARSGKRKYDLREVNISDVVQKALEDCRPQLEESGFEVEKQITEDLPSVMADEQAMTQAVQNLISNAWKYSNGSRWIRVSVKNGEGRVKIAVEDRGIGISPRDKKHLFEPFYRSREVVDEQISGNGLGLSLVKQIVDAHHGEISVESEPGKGSRFEISLSGVNDQGSGLRYQGSGVRVTNKDQIPDDST
ncbi:MAG: sensor histidine kinase [Acidobacteria bacterium]|nr:MAG: sensor histidine kinase [Acidobacteriota bacterium]REK01805.1 MAG: sensor histidine kinase [Acidobacteriota bacterium]REK14761.1 MAG: sensor histidine kinase [Acidobacteriota bacterium]REK45476.1 MAG: sensor histidine kinase [Acidobacteriota bacterium]